MSGGACGGEVMHVDVVVWGEDHAGLTRGREMMREQGGKSE